MDPKEGEALMNARIDDYKRHYQPVSDTYTYIRVVNNKRHTLNKIKGMRGCILRALGTRSHQEHGMHCDHSCHSCLRNGPCTCTRGAARCCK